MAKARKILVVRELPTEYLMAGREYLAFEAPKSDWRVRRLDDSAGTYVQRWCFAKAVADGSIVFVD